ncbi:MAG: tetratricopeptide repeat protein [Balneolaceae bacterium]|nr:tetratricopeptide repeat protein [Balneolaceae bacterium]
MSKKLSKEDLEQDILIEYSSRFMYFYNQNKATVIGGGLGIVLVIGLIIGYVFYSNQQSQQAQVLLGVAEQALMQGDIERALYGDEDEFTLGFVQIARNYGRTSSGNLANYYAAIAEFELDNYEEALEYIKRFSPPRGILGVAPISMHANILMELGRYEDAARQFERAANWDENSSTTPYNLFEAAQAYMEAGNNQRAIQHLENILAEYPNSPQATRAQRMLGMIAAG